MRLFTAIELPDEVREHLVQVCCELNIEKTTRPENLHVTLKFLGDVKEHALPDICASLGKIDSDGPIEMFGDHLLFLPQRGPIRIVASSISTDVHRVRALYSAVEESLCPFGIAREAHQYTPHVTLVRARHMNRRTASELLERTARYFPGPTWICRSFALMQSTLSARGPTYVRLTEISL